MKRENRTETSSTKEHEAALNMETISGIAPSRLLVLLTGSVILAEVLVMLFISRIPSLPLVAVALMDSLILTVIMLPLLYFFSFRPLLLQIRARKQAEKELLQREKMQGVLEMAGAACHELNQPMQALAVHAERLGRRVSDSDPLHATVGEIKELVGELASVTKKINNITRYEAREYLRGKKIIDIDRASETK